MHVVVRFLRSVGVVAGLLLLSGLVTTPAMAATTTYNFIGTFNASDVGSNLTPADLFTPPSTMSGFVTLVDPPDTNSSSVFGNYSIQSFQVTFGGGYMATMGTSGVVEIRNGGPSAAGPNADRFNVTINSPNGDNVNFLVPRLFEIALGGPTSIFSTDALPNPVPSVASFTGTNLFRLQFGPGNADSRAVSGVLTSLTAVPLPAAVILFGAGLVALVGLGAGGLRNLQAPQA